MLEQLWVPWSRRASPLAPPTVPLLVEQLLPGCLSGMPWGCFFSCQAGDFTVSSPWVHAGRVGRATGISLCPQLCLSPAAVQAHQGPEQWHCRATGHQSNAVRRGWLLPQGTLLNPCSLTPTCDKVDKANDDVSKDSNNFSLRGVLWRALMRCSRSPAAHIPVDMGRVRVGDEHSAVGLSCPKLPPALPLLVVVLLPPGVPDLLFLWA